MKQSSRTIGWGLALVVCLMVSVGLSPAPVGAHDGEGNLEVLSTVRSDATVSVEVLLTFVGDGHGVPDATVTAVVPGATPVTLAAQAEEGRYEGSLEAGAGVVIRVTSVTPAASVEVAAPPLPVEPTAPSTTVATTAPSSTDPPDATSTNRVSAGGPGDEVTAVVDDDADGGSAGRTAALVGVGAAVVALGLVLVKRSRGGSGDPEGMP